MRELCLQREGKRKRASSYDTEGGNLDFVMLNPGSSYPIFNIDGTGCITHIFTTMEAVIQKGPSFMLERKLIIRMFWDDEENASVEAPIGDFFGMGHGMSKNFWSAPLAMCPENGRGYNCFFPMPYQKKARIEIENQSTDFVAFYYYIDYEEYQNKVDSPLRFHARWRREITKGIDDSALSGTEYLWQGKNITGENNYVIMEAQGKGHYVGCNMNIHNLRSTRKENWYGEGDDMIFIDGEPWPPRLHGTGTEDYFNTAFCPQQEYCSPYSGIILGGGSNWAGKSSYYRYHIADPIMFDKSIRVTIEHGHNNNCSNDYSSTAYWYQTEPHMHYEPILPVNERIPLDDIESEQQEFIAYMANEVAGKSEYDDLVKYLMDLQNYSE